MNKAKKIFYKDGMQSHSSIAEHFGIDEDELLKVDYDWRTKTLDVYGENEEQNRGCSFMAMPEHYSKINVFIQEKIGTKQKLKIWLANNWNDKKICAEAKELLDLKGKREYKKLLKKKEWDLTILKNLFDVHPNRAWSLG